MSKDDPKLQALPAWAMGQVLLPAQFYALEESLLSHLAVRAELSGLPAYGLARLQLREGVLESEGAIAINRLTYVFQAPAPVVDVPGNTIVSDLNVDKLKTELVDGPLAVWLHLLNGVRDAEGQARYEDDDPSLVRELLRAELSLEPTHDDARESVKLFELNYDVINGWKLTDYAPPLLRVGGESSPFLGELLEGIQTNLRVLRGQVQQDIADDYLSREHNSELRRVRGSIDRMLAYMEDLGLGDSHNIGVSEHPYRLFRELRDFYVDTASNFEQPRETTPLYNHKKPTICFRTLNGLIFGLQHTAALNANAIEFDRSIDEYEIKQLDPSVSEASEVYLIIKFGVDKDRPDTREKIREFLDAFKIASPHRAVDKVVTHSLSGVPITALDQTTASIFSPKFGREALCCSLDIRHPEWTNALKDGGLRIPISEEIDRLRLYLVWNAKPPKDAGSRAKRGQT